jgi:thiaminase
MTNIKSLGVAAILFAALATPSYAQAYRNHHERTFGHYVHRNWYNSYAGPQYMQHFERGHSTSFLHPSDIKPSGS